MPGHITSFLAVRVDHRDWVVTLPSDESPAIIGSGVDCVVRIEALGAEHATVRRVGDQLILECGENPVFINGRRCIGANELKAGDEIAIGDARLVVGVTMDVASAPRRALTHAEFRERLREEVARAARGNRQLALVMLKAEPGEGGGIVHAALERFRAGDVVGTYAHDELEFLFPDTSEDTARTVVTRLLASVGARNARAGLAVTPRDATESERLLRSARLALDEARRHRTAIAVAPKGPQPPFDPIVRDPLTHALVDRLYVLAQSDTRILFRGEVNTGKTAFARLVHRSSQQSQRPFVVVHCNRDDEVARVFATNEAATPNSAEPAHDGTLLLEEVSALSAEAQTRLAKYLRVHGRAPRLLSSSSLDLNALVERGLFLEELASALADVAVDVPPLRQRSEDIIPLADRFAHAVEPDALVRWSPGALARLRAYPWPGNILELCNAVERAVHLCRGGEILSEHLPGDVSPAGGDGALRVHVDSVERDAIVRALAESNYNQTHTAKRLGISRRALIYKMEKYGLKAPPGTTGRKSGGGDEQK